MNSSWPAICRFLLIYLLLFIVSEIFKKCHLHHRRLLLTAGISLTVQLMLAGLFLNWLVDRPNPLITTVSILAMMLYSLFRLLRAHKELNRRFKWRMSLAFILSTTGILLYVLLGVLNRSLFDPRSSIPLSALIYGSTAGGIHTGIHSFFRCLDKEKSRLDTLLNIGGRPDRILLPFVSHALEAAVLPVLNGMLGMGILCLPKLSAGLLLAEVPVFHAMSYQIILLLADCTVVSLAVFGSVYFGSHTLYNERNQFTF